MEICGDMIMEKATILKEISENLPPKTLPHCLSDEQMCFSGWLSSIAIFQDDIIFCNAGLLFLLVWCVMMFTTERLTS